MKYASLRPRRGAVMQRECVCALIWNFFCVRSFRFNPGNWDVLDFGVEFDVAVLRK